MSSPARLLLPLMLLAGPCAIAAQTRAQGVIPVRFSEGTIHGFLELRSDSGGLIAHGELLQLPGDSTLVSTMRFFFRDGSRFEETTEFSQHGEFRLRHYHLIQRGPAFAFDFDGTLEADGRYHYSTTPHHGGKADEASGTVDTKEPLANGLPPIIAKNLRTGDTVTVKLVAFTPKPQLIGLRIAYIGQDSITVGGHGEWIARWELKPDLGGLKQFFAKLLGKLPPDTEMWIATEGAPTVARVRGPFYLGPVWRLDLAGINWTR